MFDEFCCVKKYTDENIERWNEINSSISDRWKELYLHFQSENIPCKNILILVEFALTLPGSNAAIERVFSLVNALWTKEKNRLHLDTVKAMIIVKTHFKGTKCVQFHELVKKEKKILEKIHSSQKYVHPVNPCDDISESIPSGSAVP